MNDLLSFDTVLESHTRERPILAITISELRQSLASARRVAETSHSLSIQLRALEMQERLLQALAQLERILG